MFKKGKKPTQNTTNGRSFGGSFSVQSFARRKHEKRKKKKFLSFSIGREYRKLKNKQQAFKIERKKKMRKGRTDRGRRI